MIGGSIGLAIKKKGLAKEVVGVFRRQSTLEKALKYKAIDAGTMDLKTGVWGADLIILATPVFSIPPIASRVIKYARRGAIITDVGSTKTWIVEHIEHMLGRSHSVSFVGSHPMAGSEHTSVEFAKSTLLEKAPCIVTRTPRTNKRALKIITEFWSCLGTNVKVMTPARHDEAVSLVSHLPHIVAFSLAGAIPEKEMVYAAEGFKDTTRVASSDPNLWADIFLTNRRQILRACRLFERYYRKMTKGLSKGDYRRTVNMLKAAKLKRDKFAYGK